MGNNYGCTCLRKDQNTNSEFNPDNKEELIIAVARKGNDKNQSEATEFEKPKAFIKTYLNIDKVRPEYKELKESSFVYPPLNQKVTFLINKNGPFFTKRKRIQHDKRLKPS